MKTLMAYFDVLLHFCPKPAALIDSPNSLYLKIFRFIRYDFRCFGDKDSHSIPQTEGFVFLDFKVHKKELLRQILRYITPGSTDHRTIFIRKVIF